jgi:hypothetical protein
MQEEHATKASHLPHDRDGRVGDEVLYPTPNSKCLRVFRLQVIWTAILAQGSVSDLMISCFVMCSSEYVLMQHLAIPIFSRIASTYSIVNLACWSIIRCSCPTLR